MSEVKVTLNAKDEIALMNRYGRKCSAQTLVKRVLAEVLRQQAENVPIFVNKEEHAAKEKAEAEAQRLAAEASKPPPEVEAILFRFQAGEKFVDLEGREVSNLSLTTDEVPEPLMAQFDADNSEWYPVELNELKPAIVCICGHDGKLVSADCRVHGAVIDAEFSEVNEAKGTDNA